MLVLDFPEFPVLETERLLLREHRSSDADILFDMRTNEEVMRYINRPRPKGLQDVQDLIALIQENTLAGKSLPWVMALKDRPEQMIGSIGYWRIDSDNHRGEFGYMLHPDYWRQGFTSEAASKTLAFGFETIGLHSMQAIISPDNDASRQLLLKHGFVKEAYFKQDYYFNGQFLDSEIYSLLTPLKD
ncbi:GNAT family N-acetyltransferase [Pedobacter sp. ASV12]|uniref:GNAT family N-acetyltransferase n=1 Tax=Pedobacter sp. ASV12 TaxID=2795120 RepID=UPI0018EDAFF1|nr:GNAT family N-acetyltransferase [Pedobacter sp. ASV12]